MMRNTEAIFINRLKVLYSVPEAKELARICLMKVFDCDFTYLLTHSPLKFTAEQQTELDSMLNRLEKGEPVQYIEGVAYFSGLSFNVAPGVLIPRPETAELVEWIKSDYVASENASIIDIGTGSGCIAVSLASLLPQAKLSAIDISEEALAIARSNAEKNGVEVDFKKVDILHQSLEGQFDVIVSNPPYICQSEKPAMHQNVLDYEPSLALFVPDDDPLLFYRRIAQVGRNVLNLGGRLYYEINERFGQETVQMLTDMGYKDVQLRTDFFGKDRMVRATR